MAVTRFSNSGLGAGMTKYDDMLAGYPPLMPAPTAADGGTGTTATVSFTAVTGATSYTALSTPGSFTGTGASSPVTVSGLTAGTAYTFQIRANNSVGNGPYSAASNSVTPVTPTAFDSIATVTVSGSSTNTLTFSSIPSTYKSLQVRGILRVTAPSDTSMRSMLIQLNGSSSTTSAFHNLRGNGTTAAAGSNTGGTSIYADVLIPTGAGANPMYGAFTMDLIDYASTSKNKTMRMFFGGQHNGYSADDVIWLESALWQSTSAVNSLTFSSSFNFVADSTLALYGIK